MKEEDLKAVWSLAADPEVLGIRRIPNTFSQTNIRQKWTILAERLGIGSVSIKRLQIEAKTKSMSLQQILNRILEESCNVGPCRVGDFLRHLYDLQCEDLAKYLQKNSCDYYVESHQSYAVNLNAKRQVSIESSLETANSLRNRIYTRQASLNDFRTLVEFLINCYADDVRDEKICQDASEHIWSYLDADGRKYFGSISELNSKNAVLDALSTIQETNPQLVGLLLNELEYKYPIHFSRLRDNISNANPNIQEKPQRDLNHRKLQDFSDQAFWNLRPKKKVRMKPKTMLLLFIVFGLVLTLYFGYSSYAAKSIQNLDHLGSQTENRPTVGPYSTPSSIKRTILPGKRGIRVHSFREYSRLLNTSNPVSVTMIMKSRKAWPTNVSFYTRHPITDLKVVNAFSKSMVLKILESMPVLQNLEIIQPQPSFCAMNMLDVIEEKLQLSDLRRVSFQNVEDCDEMYKFFSLTVGVKHLKEFEISNGTCTGNNIGFIKNMLLDARHELRSLLFPDTFWKASWYNGKAVSFLQVVELHVDCIEKGYPVTYIPEDFFIVFPKIQIFNSEHGLIEWEQFDNLYDSSSLEQIRLRLRVPKHVPKVNLFEICQRFPKLNQANLFLEFASEIIDNCQIDGFDKVKQMVPNFVYDTNCLTKYDRMMINRYRNSRIALK